MILDIAKRALAWPIVFDTYQSLVGARSCHKRFIRDMVRPVKGERVLDIGCGVGASLRYLDEGIHYVGIDVSVHYIDQARATLGHRGEFICSDITTVDAGILGTFDRAFSFGVLHHLPDDIVAQLIALVRRVVKPGGTFVTIDPCRVADQHALARILIDHDRGAYIRNPDEFSRLLSGLGHVRTELHNDLLRIPYTQLVMQVSLA